MLLPIRWEGFSLVAGEAKTFGLPAAGFDIPALRDVSGDCRVVRMARLGVVVDLYRVLTTLLQSREERIQQSQRSLQRASQLAIPEIVQ